jgi:hypothetical protein
MYGFNKKIIAIILIVALFQKLSIGLYLHNWLHKNNTYSARNHGYPVIDRGQIRCTCLEDALMPLIASAKPDGIVKQNIYSPSVIPRYCFPFIAAVKAFYSLRGPPSIA